MHMAVQESIELVVVHSMAFAALTARARLAGGFSLPAQPCLEGSPTSQGLNILQTVFDHKHGAKYRKKPIINTIFFLYSVQFQRGPLKPKMDIVLA